MVKELIRPIAICVYVYPYIRAYFVGSCSVLTFRIVSHFPIGSIRDGIVAVSCVGECDLRSERMSRPGDKAVINQCTAEPPIGGAIRLPSSARGRELIDSN